MRVAQERVEVRVVAMERGAAWEGFDAEDVLEVYLVAQQSDEPAAEFVRRVRQRLRELRDRGTLARSATFVTSCLAGELDPFSRFVLADVLLENLAVEDSDLILLAAHDASADERASLMDLAGALSHSRGAANITVRFAGASRRVSEPVLESGTRHSIPSAGLVRSVG